MYSRAKLAFKYIGYFLNAQSGKGHGIHSPFVFDFITKVVNDKTDYPAYAAVESLRKELSGDQTELIIRDYGAGSRTDNTDKRTVGSIIHTAVKPKKYGQLLFRMARYYKPAAMLELGTSLGVTTSYLSLANPDARVTTMEGSSEVADKAEDNFKSLGLENISLIRGEFDQTLPIQLEQLKGIDFVFIDGNHRYEPTMRYFEMLLSKMNKDSFMIVDDIHWSREMETAWEEIRNHEAVTCSIDLFFIGIIFFKNEFREKQEFTIRF